MKNVIVLFEVILKAGKMEDYLAQAAALKEKLTEAEGFIRAERFSSLVTEGKLLSLSEWKDEESVLKWRNQTVHRISQKHGRTEAFADYKITVATPVRAYTMSDRNEAPDDSNRFLEE